jgi:hypothetical protein
MKRYVIHLFSENCAHITIASHEMFNCSRHIINNIIIVITWYMAWFKQVNGAINEREMLGKQIFFKF